MPISSNDSMYSSIRDLSSRSKNKGRITVFRADVSDGKEFNYFHINTVEGMRLKKGKYVPDTEFQRRNINALNHIEISEDAHRILKDFDGVEKKVRIAGRVLLVAGAALDTLELYQTIENDLHDADRKIGKKTYAVPPVSAGAGRSAHWGPKGAPCLALRSGQRLCPASERS